MIHKIRMIFPVDGDAFFLNRINTLWIQGGESPNPTEAANSRFIWEMLKDERV